MTNTKTIYISALQQLAKMYEKQANDARLLAAKTEGDFDPRTGKISQEHLDMCSGCSLCQN